MTMRRATSLPPPPSSPLLSLHLQLVLLLALLLQHTTQAELEPAAAAARARIKSIAENMSNAGGDTFNIRHGRSRGAHMLYSNSSSSISGAGGGGGGSTRLTLVTEAVPPAAQPTQEPGAAPVTHKIRKLHKKKINESIRKSVDKSLGVLGVHSPKNHRSLAEAEHLQGRPTDVDDNAALDEVMQLADEIDLENSLASAFQQHRQRVANLVTELPALPPKAAATAATTPATPTTTDTTEAASSSTPPTGRQFVRAGADANYVEEDSDEDADADGDANEDALSTTQIATFAPRQVSWQLQQSRNAGRTRLLPVNRSSSATSSSSAAPATGARYADYRLEGEDVEDDDEEEDADADADDDGELQATEADASNSTELALGEWPETELLDVEVEARSQASTRQQQHEQRENLEVKQINFNYESDTESENVLDTSEVTMDDGYPPEVLIDDNSKQLVIADVVGNGNEATDGDGANGDGVDSNQITADVINARDSKIDLVSKFLQYIEQQHLMGSNCVAGTSLNLGEGVVDRYAQDRFRVEAEVAVNRANMLTR